MKLSLHCMVFIILILPQAKAAGAQFSQGGSFQYVNIGGVLTVRCPSGDNTVTCRDTFLDPWPYDVFMGPRNINAESVELRSVVGNESQIAIHEYNGKKGQSAYVNLGVYSLFQKPLLKIGENTVRYVLFGKNNTALESDTFKVSVTRGKSRSCLGGEISVKNPQDCDLMYTHCQTYFRSQNYCRQN